MRELPCVTCLVHRNSLTNVMLQSWTKVKFALVVLLHTRSQYNCTLLTSPPPPPFNVENKYFQFHLIFNTVLGGEGGGNMFLKG